MNLTEIIARDPYRRSESDITRIYHGKENCCRCGCAGRYFSRGERGFKLAVGKMAKPQFKPLDRGEQMRASYGWVKSAGVQYGENYIDIPYDSDKDRCYCLYFD